MKQFLIGIAIISFVLFAIYMQMSLWEECRATNSFWYCMRVLSK